MNSFWKIFIIALFLLGVPKVLKSQTWDPDTCWTCEDTRLHAVAGGLIDAGLHLPIAPKGFRDTIGKRLLVVGVIGLVYEVGQLSVAQSTGVAGQPGYGISPKDLVADMFGAVVVEGIILLIKEIKQ